jgi:hypothetical protein
MEKTYNEDNNYCTDKNVIACAKQYSSNCPRTCRLFDDEQGDATDLKRLENLFKGEHIEGDEK